MQWHCPFWACAYLAIQPPVPLRHAPLICTVRLSKTYVLATHYLPACSCCCREISQYALGDGTTGGREQPRCYQFALSGRGGGFRDRAGCRLSGLAGRSWRMPVYTPAPATPRLTSASCWRKGRIRRHLRPRWMRMRYGFKCPPTRAPLG